MEREGLRGDEHEPHRREEEFGIHHHSDDPSLLKRDLFERADPRIFVADPDDPEDGRTFVWSPIGWFERLEGDSGAVEFTPVAQDEEELREWLSQESIEITEIDVDEEFGRTVREEFLEQTPLYPEAPELSDQEITD